MTKRVFDFLVSLVLMVLLLPCLLVLVILVRIFLGSPVLFFQQRPGMNAEEFCMVKFRTMKNTKDVNGHDLADSERLTSFGKLLRSTSLDELPSLVSVLKGDMSLVGPRPLLPEYLPLYNQRQARRHEVRPGVTGWAQVNGRNAIGWADKFELDIWYVENQSFWLDIKILFMTLGKVFRRAGISANGDDTMPRFTGSSSKRESK